MKPFLLSLVCACIMAAAIPLQSHAQETLPQNQPSKKKLTRSQILKMTVEELREMSLEDLTDLANIVGVSSIEV